MRQKRRNLIAVGGGELSESLGVLEEIDRLIKPGSNTRLVVMTVATSEAESAKDKYNRLFRSRGFKHVDTVNVEQRNDAFDEASLKKVRTADAMFFTGGDQLNVTSLLGGSPLHNLIHERYLEGVLIAGTSAGAAMMSSSMIISGKSDTAPRVSGVEIAPGMNMVDGTIIDSHFSERGRHGRLLTAIAHYPQVLGLGIDEQTAAVFQNGGFKVVGKGVVTVVDGSQMRHSNLPYRHDSETIGLFGVAVHTLPSGYSFKLKERTPVAAPMKKMAGTEDEV